MRAVSGLVAASAVLLLSLSCAATAGPEDTGAPAGELRVIVDGIPLDQVKSNEILGKEGLLLDRIKKYAPSAENAQIVLNITGDHIKLTTLGLRYGGQDHDVDSLDNTKTSYVLCDGYGERFGYCPGQATMGILGDKFTHAELAAGVGIEMIAYVRAVDQIGRSTTIPFLSRKVTALEPGSSLGPGSSTETHWLGLSTP
ncbi:MAG: hypothetical protein ACLPOA_12115 [Methylocella sp.]